MSPLHPLVATASLLCADPPAAAQTSVELRVTSVDDGEAKLLEQLLMRQLGDRLLEDGYRVVPAGELANVRVWIHLGVDEASVETRGVDRQVERIADGDPQVMALELQQLTIALIDEVQSADAQPRPAIAIEVAGAAVDPQLRERLQIGLLERGYALTRAPSSGDLRLCVIARPEGVAVHAIAAVDACDPDSSATLVREGASVEIERELLLDEASASLERFRAGPTEQPVTVPVEPEELPPAIDTAPIPEPKPEPRPVSVTVDASGGVLGRAGGTDPLLGVELRGGRRRGVGGGLALALVPSRAEALRVIEILPTATLDLRLGFASRGLAILGVFAGAHVHRYAYQPAGAEAGTRVGPSVGASVRAAYLGDRGALVFGGVRAGWSGGGWIHLDDGAPSWRRSRVMIGVELGAGWDFVMRGRR